MAKKCSFLIFLIFFVSKVLADTDVKDSLYSVPWQLRPIMAVTALRIDSAFATYDDSSGDTGGSVVASIIAGSLKLGENFALIARLGGVSNDPGANQIGKDAFLNPQITGLYSLSLSPKFKMAFTIGATIPVGSGGGNNPNEAIRAALSAGSLARSALDNSLFSVNYFSLGPGIGAAFISNGWTVQLEGILIASFRTRGEQVDEDDNRVNFTTGMLVGYSFTPLFFMEAELRYQRWAMNDTVFAGPDGVEENLSLMIGPRFNFKIGDVDFRPGIAYAQGLSGPMAKPQEGFPTNSYKIIFVDIPIIF